MDSISFQNDYAEGAHPRILDRLRQTNLQQEAGYGQDRFCTAAAERIRELTHQPDADIHFVIGGTQANLIVLSALLQPYESVIAAETGHIVLHEAGAIEATGHKIIAVPGVSGKLTPSLIQTVLDAHTDELNTWSCHGPSFSPTPRSLARSIHKKSWRRCPNSAAATVSISTSMAPGLVQP